MNNNQIDNNVFGKLDAAQLSQIKSQVIPDAKIRLCGTLMTPSREIVPIAEALVAYDPQSDTIVKFLAAFIPPHPRATHDGVKYLISKDEDGQHKPIVITHDKNKKNKNNPSKKMFWNPHFLTAFLDYEKLPVYCAHAEFRILRAYRAGLRVPYRFELLAFDIPNPGDNVDKKTMQVEVPYNSVPPIHLARCYRTMFWWQKQIVAEISDFSGVDLSTALGLGIKRKLDQAVKAGHMAQAVEEEILHDHSEDPVEVSEPLSVSLGINTNMVKDEEGKSFFVPDNPMLKNVKEEEEEEELVELLD